MQDRRPRYAIDNEENEQGVAGLGASMPDSVGRPTNSPVIPRLAAE
jgi:DNA-binding IclR family transcriptional regulator